MGDPVIDPTDLGTYLGLTFTDAQVTRVAKIIEVGQTLCEAVVNPLPAGAEAVVMDVVTRAFTNPTNADAESTGPNSVNWGAVSGGLWLTKQNRATLKLLNGTGGAFTIDPTPATAGQGLPWWDNGSGAFYPGQYQ